VRPFIAKTPSVAAVLGKHDDMVTVSQLSEDGSYYTIRVGVNNPDRFDPWFTLRLTRDGEIFRETTDAKTLEIEWSLESRVSMGNDRGEIGQGRE
jgi:hypothetical protein